MCRKPLKTVNSNIVRVDLLSTSANCERQWVGEDELSIDCEWRMCMRKHWKNLRNKKS